MLQLGGISVGVGCGLPLPQPRATGSEVVTRRGSVVTRGQGLAPSRHVATHSAATAGLAFAAAAVTLRQLCGRRPRCTALWARPLPDAESLRWQRELALRNEEYMEAARLSALIPDADEARPSVALRGLLHERVRGLTDAGLDQAAPPSRRLEAVRQLQGLATPPCASQQAEDGLHWVLRDCHDDEVAMAAENALWAAWLPSGDEAIDAMMQRGLQCMAAGELKEAEEAFTEVIEAEPLFAEGWNKRATALFLAAKFDESIQDCHKVLALKPRHFGCLSGIGICHLRTGDQESAMKCLRQASEVNPHSSDTKRIVADLEARAALAVLQPRLQQALAELDGWKESLNVGEGAEVSARWDAHRVTDLDGCTYFFRVKVESVCNWPLEGFGRYYALKPATGPVFPLSRLTQGTAGFRVKPGESYDYSFMLTVREELVSAKGGLLFKGGEEKGKEDFVEACLPRISLHDAPHMGEAELGRMNEGFHFMGRVEIRLE